MTKLQTLRSILIRAGHQPRVQDDFVAFDHDGGHYVIPVDSDDPQYVRVIFPNFWPIEDDAEHRRVLEVAAQIHSTMKNVKIFPSGAQTMASIELLLPDAESFAAVFPRALTALTISARNFQLMMQLARGDAPGGSVAIADLLRRMLDQVRGEGRGGERGREAG